VPFTDLRPAVGVRLAVTAACVATAFTCRAADQDCAVTHQAPSLLIVADPADAPEWAVPYGKEFWLRACPDRADTEAGDPSGPNIGDVIERVSHAVRRQDGDSLPTVRGNAYTAQFGGKGLTMTPEASGCTSRDAGAQIRTLSVKVGDVTLYKADQSPPKRIALGNTVQALLNRDVGLVEHIEARPEGLELSWVLNRKPSADGDLRIEWEMTAEGGRPGLHVGDVTAVGRRGRSQAVPMHSDGSRFSIDVPAGLLNEFSYPLAIDPTITPEFVIGDPVYTNAVYVQTVPDVSWGDGSWLVVWEDNRENPLHASIYGARVAPAGDVLDIAGIPIGTTSDEFYPEVSWGGTNWLVVWVDDDGVRGARVDAAGTVLDTNSIAISTGGGDEDVPDVAWGSDSWLVVWRDTRDYAFDHGFDVYGSRVNADGTVLEPGGLAISAHEYKTDYPHVAWNGTYWLVVWCDYRDDPTSDEAETYGARVTTEGSVLDATGILIGSVEGQANKPDVAGGAGYWLVAWVAGTNDIFGARVTSGASVLDETPIPICVNTNHQGPPAVAWGAGVWLVVWSDDRNGVWWDPEVDLYAARVNTSGSVLDYDGFPISTATGRQVGPAMASDGSSWLVAWLDERIGFGDVRGTRISSGGSILQPSEFVIATMANIQQKASCSWGGTNWLVVWEDFRNGLDYDIYGTRVNPYGGVLDPAGIAVCTGTHWATGVDVAKGGADWLVVWEDTRGGVDLDIHGARVNEFGAVRDPTGIVICAAVDRQDHPKVSGGDTDWLVVWEDERQGVGGGNCDIYGARVNAAGSVMDGTGFLVCAVSNAPLDPDLAWGQTSWLVAWRDYRNLTDQDVYGTRVDASGNVLDANGIAISTASVQQTHPSLAWAVTNWLVAWADTRYGGTEIFGARVSPDGLVLETDGLAICSTSGEQQYPVVTGNDSYWMVFWQDYRDLVQWDIYGSLIMPGGWSPTGPFGIHYTPTRSEWNLDAAFGPPGTVLVTFDNFRPYPYNATRVMGLIAAEEPLLTIDASHGPHGTIVPSGTVYVPSNATAGFVVTADTYCHIDEVVSNDVAAGGVNGLQMYTSVWRDITETGTVVATFAENLATNDVPEWWLALYGWTNNFDAAALGNPDGDGHYTWEEWIAGTVPTNGESFLWISNVNWTASATGIVLQWPSVEGREYDVTWASNLSSGFSVVASNLPATAPANTFTNSVLDDDLFEFLRLNVRHQ